MFLRGRRDRAIVAIYIVQLSQLVEISWGFVGSLYVMLLLNELKCIILLHTLSGDKEFPIESYLKFDVQFDGDLASSGFISIKMETEPPVSSQFSWSGTGLQPFLLISKYQVFMRLDPRERLSSFFKNINFYHLSRMDIISLNRTLQHCSVGTSIQVLWHK